MSVKEDGIAMVIFAAELAELMAEMLGRRGPRLYTVSAAQEARAEVALQRIATVNK